jgi:hypothetical protein
LHPLRVTPYFDATIYFHPHRPKPRVTIIMIQFESALWSALWIAG